MIIGSHVSIRDGYLGAAKKAASMNASAFQYFPKNPRSLTVKKFNKDDTLACKNFCETNNIKSVSHSPYPTNLTPLSNSKKDQVVQSLLNDLEITEACGSIGVVVHFGRSISKKDPLASYQLMIEVLNEVLKEWKGVCKILLENNAGKPGTIGTTLEELVQVRNLSDFPEKIGFCFDTCHAFASGLWDGENWDEVVELGTKLGYFEELHVIHLNNSKYETRSGKDRHANIFNNVHITEQQFDNLIQSSVVESIPLILETPKDSSYEIEIKSIQQKWGGK